MKALTITAVLWLALAATAMGQAKATSDTSRGSAPSKAMLEEIRSFVHQLEARTELLRQLLDNHRDLVEDRPSKGEQQAKWEAALDRLMVRIGSAHAALVETKQKLDKAISGELPTGLGKDVARAKNEAEPERVMAEQLLSKHKPAKKAKPEAAKPPPENNEDYDL